MPASRLSFYCFLLLLLLSLLSAGVQAQTTVTWTGAVSSDWFEAGNWSTGQVPSTDDFVVIADQGIPTAIIGSGEVTIAKLRVIDQGRFQLDEGATLIISGGEDGLEIDCAATTNLNGNVQIADQEGTYGMIVASDVIQGTNGTVILEDEGLLIENATLTINGALTITEAPEDGIDNEEGYLEIGATGSCTISAAARDGIGFVAFPTSVTVDGQLSITDAGRTGINISQNFTVGATGTVSILGSGQEGVISLDATVEGTMIIAGSTGEAISADSDVVVATGGTLRVEGQVDSEVLFASGSRLEPGSSPGCLTFVEDINLTGATVAVELEGLSTCGDYDQIIYNDNSLSNLLNIDGATLELSGGYVPSLSESFTIIDVQAGTMSGTFANLLEGGALDFNGTTLEISYSGGGGNDVVLTCIAAPPTAITWTGAEDTNWGNANNWDGGVVPGSTDSVFIPAAANAPIVNTGFARAGAIEVSGGNLTLAAGTILIIADQNTGLNVTNNGVVNVNGPLNISGQQSTGLNVVNGFVFIGVNGRLSVDNSFAEIDLGIIQVSGGLTITNAVADGLRSFGTGGVLVMDTGTLNITNAAADGLALGDATAFVPSGTTTITGCGGDGIDLSAGAGITVGANGSLSVTDCAENGIRLGNDTTEVINNGFLSLLGNEDAALFGGLLTNEIGATLQAAGFITADFTSKSSSTLEVGDGIDGLLFFGTTSFNGASIILDLEGTDLQAGEHDVLNFPGGGDLSGAELVLRGSYLPSVGDVFTIHNTGLFALISGTYNGLPDGGTLLFNGVLLEIEYGVAGTPTFQIDLTATTILPLDLLSFTGEARDKTNLLTWTTANEEDFSHFEVQRSPDGQGPWSVLAEPDLQASGVHEYIDESPLPTAYYRLKMIDLDGTFSYSKVVYLKNNSGEDAGAMFVYPNPSTGRFTVDLSEAGLLADGGGELRLVDLHGREIWSQRITTDQPTLLVEQAQPRIGVYLLMLVTDDNQTKTRRIVIH